MNLLRAFACKKTACLCSLLTLSLHAEEARSVAQSAKGISPEQGALDLSATEDRCLQNSQDLMASRLQERSARFAYLQSIGAFLPSLDLSGGWVKQGGLPSSKVHQVSISQALLAPEQTIQLAQKRLDWGRAILRRIALENRLLLSVRSAYFTCVLKKAVEQDQRNKVMLLRSSFDQERSRLATGQSTALEVNQVQVALSHALTDYFQSAQAVRMARDELASLLGIDERFEGEPEVMDREILVENIPFLKEKLARLPVDFLSLNSCGSHSKDPLREIAKSCSLFDEKCAQSFIAQALAYQPDLRMAVLDLEGGRLAVKEKKSLYLPKIAATCLQNNIEYPLGTLLNGKQRWQAQIQVSWNLFNGLARERGLRASELNVRAMECQLIKQRSDLRRKILERLYSIEVRLLAYSASNQGALVAEQAVCLAKERYRLGEITPLDFRQSVNQLLGASVQRAGAGCDAMIAYFNLLSDCADQQDGELDALTRLMR